MLLSKMSKLMVVVKKADDNLKFLKGSNSLIQASALNGIQEKECEVQIDKSVPRITIWFHSVRLVMPNCNPRSVPQFHVSFLYSIILDLES